MDNTYRVYGPNLYSRALVESDVEHVKRILYDWEDWPLTDEKAESLTKVWSQKAELWQAPFFEGMPRQESTTLFCLKSNDLPVCIDRSAQYDTTAEHILAATCPDHRLNGYSEEVSKLMAIPGWDLMNMQKSILKQRVGIQNMGDNHPRHAKEGTVSHSSNRYTQSDYVETVLTLEEWSTFKNSSLYAGWAIDCIIYPTYPGDPL